MPIRPENKKLYPKNWPEIREKIKARAGNKCDICGVENHAIGYRTLIGEFVKVCMPDDDKWEEVRDAPKKCFRIVCTVMHLNHDPTDNRDENLKFGCQKCHNNYDAKFRAENRKRNKQQMELIK